jgi:hypothetical protein
MLSYLQTLWPIESMQIRCSGYGAEYACFSWMNMQLGSSAIEFPSFCHTGKPLSCRSLYELCKVWIKPIRKGGVLGSCATNNLRRTLFVPERLWSLTSIMFNGYIGRLLSPRGKRPSWSWRPCASPSRTAVKNVWDVFPQLPSTYYLSCD